MGYKKGYIPWNKGINLSPSYKLKLSIAHKGQKAWNKGIKGIQKSHRKGISNIEEYGTEKANEIKEKISKIVKQSINRRKPLISKTLKEKYVNGELISHFCNEEFKIKNKKFLQIFNRLPKIRKRKSKTLMGHLVSSKTIKKISLANKGKSLSQQEKEHLRNMRINQIQKIMKERGYKTVLQLGKYETVILDNLEKCFNYKILRQYRIAGFFIDGYCPALKLAIEVDEKFHKQQIQKDVARQNIIEERLNCHFLRIPIGEVV